VLGTSKVPGLGVKEQKPVNSLPPLQQCQIYKSRQSTIKI
jgi:hypothetical protein